MTTMDTGFRPDPEDAASVLAFVLCPARVFAPHGDDAELAAVNELMLPVKTEAARQCLSAVAKKRRS
jgi:hypothetical protein